MTGIAAVQVELKVPFDLEQTVEGRFVVRNDDLRIAVSGASEESAIAAFSEGVQELAAFEQEQRGVRLDPLSDLLQPA